MSDPPSLSGKRALVTGAAGPGIGQACARLLAERGARVWVSDRSARRAGLVAAELAEATGSRVLAHTMDVGDPTSIAAGIAEVTATGGLDVLVNSAGVTFPGPFAETTPEQLRATLDVCLIGTFLAMQAVLPGMVERGGGAIVNISSIEAFVGSRTPNAAYAAAKAGVLALTRSVAAEYGPRGVRVNAVAPGFVPNAVTAAVFDEAYTDGLVEATPLGRTARPDEIARAVLFLAEEASSFVTGDVLTVSGGLYFHA